MSGQMSQIVEDLRARLAQGYEAKIVGGEPLKGKPPLIVEVDGQRLLVPSKAVAQDGVLLTGPDGYTVLYATISRERAEQLLANAREVA